MHDLDSAKIAPQSGEKRASGWEVKDRARRQFDGWAQGYDRSIVQHLLFQPAYRMLMEELYGWRRDDLRPFDLLDVGCGTGAWIAMLAGSLLRWRRLVGLDYSARMCRMAGSKARVIPEYRPAFVNADSEHVPFADESFDVVTCSHSFHHYPNQAESLKEMRRMLRPGGRLLLVDGFRDNVIGWVLFDVFITRAESTPTAKVFHAPWRLMRTYFEAAGFREIHQRKFNIWAPLFITVGIA